LVDIIADSVIGTDAEQQYKSVLAMIAFGVGEILGCFFIGWVVDKYGSRKASWVNVGICLIMTVVTIAFLVIN
jgi:MFS family permease